MASEKNKKAQKVSVDTILSAIPNIETVMDGKKLANVLQLMATYNNSIYAYIKNYKGEHIRGNKSVRNYRFYDEREWRYVPSLKDKDIKRSLTEDEFRIYRGHYKKKPFIKNINLPFTSKNIKYLLVKSDSDVPKIIKAINETPDLCSTGFEVDLLYTRIITYDQLKTDF